MMGWKQAGSVALCAVTIVALGGCAQPWQFSRRSSDSIVLVSMPEGERLPQAAGNPQPAPQSTAGPVATLLPPVTATPYDSPYRAPAVYASSVPDPVGPPPLQAAGGPPESAVNLSAAGHVNLAVGQSFTPPDDGPVFSQAMVPMEQALGDGSPRTSLLSVPPGVPTLVPDPPLPDGGGSAMSSDAPAAPSLGQIAGARADGAEHPTAHARFQTLLEDIWEDHKNYYSWTTLWEWGAAVGVNAALANSTADQQVADWYQTRVRTSSTDKFSKVMKNFGEGGMAIPVWAGVGIVGSLLDQYPAMGTAGDFGMRTTRAYLVGGPPLLLMQYALGAGRPTEQYGSEWRFFQNSKGASGHAFIGSVPFIVAGDMADNWALKGGLYFCSTLTAWSRVNDNAHYLSQAWLGWWMGFLAAQAVNDTQMQNKHFHIVPVASPDMTGVMMMWDH